MDFNDIDFLDIDFEFFDVSEEKVELVCCSIATKSGLEEFWLLDNPTEKARLIEFLNKNITNIFRGYQTTAESRSFISLDLIPHAFKWVDLFIEYRCLSNHNDEIMFGEHLVEGVIKKTRRLPPKWQRTEEDERTSFKPKHSLVEATYKFLKIKRDQERKDHMRDIIISGDRPLINENKKKIMDYCTEDVMNLSPLFNAMVSEYKRLLKRKYIESDLLNEMLLRGLYSALTAKMESVGYPINVEKTRAFSKAIPHILFECRREINSLFPEIKPFRWNKKENKFSWNQVITKNWLEKNVNIKRWKRTDSGDLSLSLEAFTEVFDFKHSYPKDNFGAQIVRYLKLKQSLNGFSEARKKDKKIFWDYVGRDGRVRPYTNPYGAQSSRSQPAATGFLFLKPAWMRSLCEPSPGKAVAGIDYSSQETLLAGIWANDKNLIKAYASGDVYLAYAKAVKAVPQEATKSSHGKERNYFKPIVLSMQYLMTKYGLSAKLTQDTGKIWSEDEAQVEIDKYNSVYWKLHEKQNDLILDFKSKNLDPIKLPCGWYHWKDNDNFRSICNVGVQGLGATILRKAVEIAIIKYNLNVIFTLHDAIYIEYDSFDFGKIDLLKQAMYEATVYYFTNPIQRNAAELIRMEASTWSPDYTEEKTILTPGGFECHMSQLYIDERSEDEYEQFSKYFEPDEALEIL